MTSPTLNSVPLVGLSGWQFPHWDGAVYPNPKPARFHPLKYLSAYFDIIEIGSTFYQNARPEIARLWSHQVAQNPRFRFTAKLHRQFTHERRLEAAQVTEFHAGLRPLADAGKLGCVLMQFPWSFRFTPENREYFIQLRRTFSSFPLAAEMRHSSWMCEEALGTFIDYRVGFVNIDQPDHVKAMPPTSFLTSKIGYVRFHGRNNANWMSEFSRAAEPGACYDYLYSPRELEDWLPRIQKARMFASESYIVFANDAGGKAVVNALQAQSLIEGRRRVAPAPLASLFGEELRDWVERPKQETLFEIPARPAPPLHRAVA